MSAVAETHDFSVEGMHCVRCLQKVQSLGREKFAAESVTVNLDRGQVSLKVSSPFEPDQFISSMHSLGFPTRKARSPDASSVKVKSQSQHLLARLGVAGACSGNIMLISFAIYSGADLSQFMGVLSWLSFFLFLPVLTYSAFPILQNSWNSLKLKSPSVDIPLAVALVLGTGLSTANLMKGSDQFYFDSLSIFVFLILSSRYFITKLQQKHLQPISIANVFGTEKVEVTSSPKSTQSQKPQKPIDQLQAGDRVRLAKNHYIPADCRLISPKPVEVNQAFLTGESQPILIMPNSKLLAGSQLLSETATVEVLTSVKESGLSKLIDRVNEALHQKTVLTSFTDRVATYFTVFVIASTVIVFVAGVGLGIGDTFNRILALLVISCPCALAIATPLSLSLAIKNGFKQGLLIKRADVFERMQKLSSVGFDKTGTLTSGLSKVSNWLPFEPSEEQKQIIGSLEAESSHPFAKALLSKIGVYQPVEIQNREEVAGLGVRGSYLGKSVEVRKLEDPKLSGAEYRVDGSAQLRAEIRSELRAEAASVIHSLQASKKEIFVLTGDTQTEALRTASELGLASEFVHSNLSPEKKASFIALKSSKTPVGFVGDGINDSLALAKADLAISMGGSPEVTFNSSDVHLINASLDSIIVLDRLSQKALRVIYRNLVMSLGYNLSFGALAVFGLINPLIAAVLMPLSSVTVVGHTFLSLKGHNKERSSQL